MTKFTNLRLIEEEVKQVIAILLSAIALRWDADVVSNLNMDATSIMGSSRLNRVIITLNNSLRGRLIASKLIVISSMASKHKCGIAHV